MAAPGVWAAGSSRAAGAVASRCRPGTSSSHDLIVTHSERQGTQTRARAVGGVVVHRPAGFATRRLPWLGPWPGPCNGLVRSLQGGRGRHKLVFGPTWPIVGPWRPARGQPQEPGVPEATSKGSGLGCCCWFGSEPHRVGQPPRASSARRRIHRRRVVTPFVYGLLI